jgi:hypothetical protein
MLDRMIYNLIYKKYILSTKGFKMTGLTNRMKNVLDAFIDQTVISKGKNKGQVKNRISGDCYDMRTVNALYKRGLIDYKDETIHGSGFAATAKALNVI